MKRRCLLVCTVLAAACGDPPADPAAEEGRDSDVFTPLTDTIDRAGDVQSTIDAEAEELRRRIDEAEQ